MPNKSYDELAPETQEAIDSAIYCSEASRIIGGAIYTDGRIAFVDDPVHLVDYLRALYAIDIQSLTPRFHEWSTDCGDLRHGAIYLQQNMSAGMQGMEELNALVGHLASLPYPDELVAPRRRR